jgi:hypothetical protein
MLLSVQLGLSQKDKNVGRKWSEIGAEKNKREEIAGEWRKSHKEERLILLTKEYSDDQIKENDMDGSYDKAEKRN